MANLWTVPFALLFALVVLQLELLARRKAGAEPSGWGALYRLLSKKTSSDLPTTALLFALSSTVLFALWEGLLRAALDLQGAEWRLVPAFLCMLSGLALRRLSPKSLYREDLALLLLAILITLGSWFSLLFLPWVAWRSRHLKFRWKN